MVNLIDMFESSLFLGSVVNTIHATFPYVYVVAESEAKLSSRNTFVVIASKKALDIKGLVSSHEEDVLDLWYLSESEMRQIKEKSSGLLLTDDYVPTENLLAPVVVDSSKEFLARKHIDLAKRFKQQGNLAKSTENYLAAAETLPYFSITGYHEAGMNYAEMKDYEKAAEAFQKAVDFRNKVHNEKHPVYIGATYFNLGTTLKKNSRNDEARQSFEKAIEEYKLTIEEEPSCMKYKSLGDIYATIGDFKSASVAFFNAMKLNSKDPLCYRKLISSLLRQNRVEEAIRILQEEIRIMNLLGNRELVLQLEKQLEELEHQQNGIAND